MQDFELQNITKIIINVSLLIMILLSTFFNNNLNGNN